MVDRLRQEVTTVLQEAQAGLPAARDRLVALVYDEMREMASGLMRGERADHTLQPTALVHEALIRLLDQDALAQASNRRYLFAAAARAMRQVLIDHARARGAAKRAGDRGRAPLDETVAWVERQSLDVLDLHEGLDELARLHERQARIVELRFFGGLTVEEIAGLLDVSISLVEKDLRKARAFLRCRITPDG